MHYINLCTTQGKLIPNGMQKNIRCNIRKKKVNVVIYLNINSVLKNLSYQNILKIFSILTELF